MTKIWIAVLAVLLAASSLWGCARGGYTLLDVPKELKIDVKSLSEDADNLMPSGESTPLIAALPEEGLYVYATDATVAAGALVKYDGVLQYFPWRFTPQLAKPKLYVTDYNGDGKKDVAITFAATTGVTHVQENLRVLLREEKGFHDILYSTEKAILEAGTHMLVENTQADQFAVFVDGARKSFSLSGHGKLSEVIFDRWQEYTLGETITVQMRPELYFQNEQEPTYTGMIYTAEISLQNGVLTQTNAQVTL